MAKNLVIVESPAKAKTINKFLGRDYTVTASMGHVIDLPKSKLGIDVENDFKPQYVVMADRKKNLSSLKKDAKTKQAVYLAADPDREGEAISWHIKNALFDEKKKFYRVSFDEITKDAVKEAFKNPRDIDMNLVNAQQARRILDRIVGYTLSPLLWKKVSRGLSAGRVQSVAVRLIVEREEEIKKFMPLEYWHVEAEVKRKGDSAEAKFRAKLEKYKGKDIEIKKNDEADRIVAQLKKERYVVSDIKESKKRKNPSPPFTTSKLQQDAFNQLRFSSARTMQIAQTLYEGIDIGEEGQVGLITYMRTDSVRISKDAQKGAKDYILENFGKRYYPDEPNVYKSRKTAQDAHEAIRPALPLRTPDSLKDYLSPDQMKLYKLIWDRFLASQMSQAVYSQTSVDIKAGEYLFKAGATTVVFDGFTAVYEADPSTRPEVVEGLAQGQSRASSELQTGARRGTDKEEEKEKTRLPQLSVDEPIDLLGLLPSQHFTKPPPRYSDGTLVKALEEFGIGRPSTYAPIIQTIVSRDYVQRESGYFRPTDLGTIVTHLLIKHFPQVLDVQFTAMMEDELDGIEEGEIDWLVVLKSFYSPFIHAVEKAKVDMKDMKQELSATDQVCEMCGRPMIIKWGRRGRFLSCSGYPECKNAKSITTGVKCPVEGCGGELIQRKSRMGAFYGCTKYPKCTYVSRKLPDKDKVAENPPPMPS